jgi:hypothetical protein
MHTHHLRRTRRLVLAAATMAAVLALSACGGEDAPLPDSSYISWTGSANGVRILDWNNEAFAVRTDTGAVARYSDDLILTGLTVSNANVFWNGGLVGSVTYTTATTGARIVDFTCNDGREMDITVTGSGNSASWSFRCV